MGTNGFSSEPIAFNRDVRPILAANCFHCHGMDAKSREADLRLDLLENATAQRDSGKPAISPVSIDNSAVWDRITSTDPNVVMPPPSSKHQLSDDQKSILKSWIEQGAGYQKHWSFEPIVLPPMPELDDREKNWSANTAIDQFIAARHVQVGLAPNPPADRQTLIRRVAFTLTGLPPTTEELAAFENDESKTAYDSMVQRYLDSPRFGEEMARHWLDVARYGDTHGLHLDNARNIWAYRDWVVDAFNRNLSFDTFTIEQLAGDLLPSPTTSQMVATGFQRCNVTTSEGGAINEEFLFRYAVDRASTTVQAWLGLTGGCAVCHDHKFDPISAKEFYSLYAFFYNNEDPAMDGNIASTSPMVTLATPTQQASQDSLKVQIEKIKASLESMAGSNRDALPTEVVPVAFIPTEVVDVFVDDSFPLGATQNNTSRNPPEWMDNRDLMKPEPMALATGSSTTLGERSLYQSFGERFQQTISGGIVNYVVPKDPALVFSIRLDKWQPPQSIFIELKTNQGNKRWEWKRKTSNTNESDRILPEPDQWHRIEIHGDEFGLVVGAEVQEIQLGQFGGTCWWDAVELHGSTAADNDYRTDRDRWWNSRKGKDTALASGELNTVLKAGKTEQISDEAVKSVDQFYRAWIARDSDAAILLERSKYLATSNELQSQIASSGETMVYKDRSESRQAFIMERGQYDKPGMEVKPAVPVVFPTLVPHDPSKSATRLDLARWLVDDRNPMVARVTVNRFWQQVFGTGLVKTSDDFGTQGAYPSHPELLDFLAYEFRSKGWNVKELMRALVSTKTFQQSSVVLESVLQKDPENRYLARGPRIRLDAEQLRDNALAVSGLLSEKMGGPGVKTYQPTNIWEPVGYGDSNTRYYIQDHGDALYRRSLYCFIKRTAPPPFMSNFDAPNREQFCTRRERSDTPLQALQLMNDVQHVEAARNFAERILEQPELTSEERIRYAFRVLLSRDPSAEESVIVLENLEKLWTSFKGRQEDAVQLCTVGESDRNKSLDVAELASYMLVANMLLNLDETLNRN